MGGVPIPRTTKRAVAALVCGTLVCAAFIVPSGVVQLTATLVVRAIFVGLVVGLLVGSRTPAWAAAAIGASGTSFGLLLSMRMPAQGLFLAAVVLSALVAVLVRSIALADGRHGVAVVGVGLVVVTYLWLLGVLPGPFTETHDVHMTYSMDKLSRPWVFDGAIFTRTEEAVRRGEAFYPAFRRAVEEDERRLGTPTVLFNYREPYLFWLWSVLPGQGPQALWWYYVVLSTLALVPAYLIASRLVHPGAALAAPMLLTPFLYWLGYSQCYMFAEVWAGLMMLFAALAVVRQRWLLGAVLLTVAVAFRELAVVFIPAFVAAWAAAPERRNEIPALAVLVLGPAAVLGAHIAMAPVSRSAAGLDFSSWLHGGLRPLIASLSFGSKTSLFGPYLAQAAPVAAFVGGFFARPRWRAVLLSGSVLFATVFLFAVSRSEFGFYWGAILTPLSLCLGVSVLSPLAPSGSDDDAAPTRSAASIPLNDGRAA